MDNFFYAFPYLRAAWCTPRVKKTDETVMYGLVRRKLPLPSRLWGVAGSYHLAELLYGQALSLDLGDTERPSVSGYNRPLYC